MVRTVLLNWTQFAASTESNGMVHEIDSVQNNEKRGREIPGIGGSERPNKRPFKCLHSSDILFILNHALSLLKLHIDNTPATKYS